MYDFEKTRLWQTTLAPRPEDEDSTAHAKERLRNAYFTFRDRAAVLANEIHRILPDFTVHDISHSDALWEMADSIAGPNVSLTPTEAFVLGGAFLVHDLGMALAAYPQGLTALRNDPSWQDTIAALQAKKFGRPPYHEEILHPDEEIERYATEVILRTLHAKRAEELALISWQDENKGPYYHLIEDTEFRLTYGKLIGKIAHSHTWSVSELYPKFRATLGAPPRYPSKWSVDPLKIACLLRVADASHIDARRAPGFLQALRKPGTLSREHWLFQEHLNQPELKDGRLTYSSAGPFTLDEAQSWWLCIDTLRMIDQELRLVDALLADSRRERFIARGVTAIEELSRLVEYLPTEGWHPVDTSIRVTDIADLVRKLGGEELYGHNLSIPLRELIQNATDSIRARRCRGGLPQSWGEICVRLNEDEEGPWLEVEDNGVGMSAELLTGPLLDFGKSYWGSELMRNELPGLLSKGFEYTGKYGIGFFSVFMLGNHVRVTSRKYDLGVKDTKVLEFNHGLVSRAILRDAHNDEWIQNGGTCIRVWLKDKPDTPEGLLSQLQSRKSIWTLRELCEHLCPSIDANLFVETPHDGKELAITACDWIDLDGKELLKRLWYPYDERKKPGEALLNKLSSNLQLMKNSSGQVWPTPLSRQK